MPPSSPLFPPPLVARGDDRPTCTLHSSLHCNVNETQNNDKRQVTSTDRQQ